MRGAWVEFAGLGLGLALWAGLRLVQRRRGLSRRELGWTLFAAGLAARLLFAAGTPAFDAPDEHSHFAYVRYLSEHAAFPVQTAEALHRHDREYCQPPLYYLLLVPLYRWASPGGSEPSILGALRAASILLWALQFALVWSLAETLELPPLAETGMLAFSALLPSVAFLGSVVNNDAALAVLAAATMLLLLRSPSRAASLGAGLLLALGLYAKYLAVFVYGFAVLVLLLERWEPSARRRTPLGAAAVLALPWVLWAPWGLRNLRLYGMIFAAGSPLEGSRPHWTSLFQGIGRVLGYLLATFWAAAGDGYGFRYRHFPAWILTAVPLWGWWKARGSRRMPLKAAAGRFLLAGTAAFAAATVVTFRFGWTTGQSQGRYLYPLLPVVSLLWIIGADEAAGGRLEPVDVAGLFLTYLLGFAGDLLR